MSRSLRAMRANIQGWLTQGISPQRLALTLALGFVIGCIPIVGIGLPTGLCLVLSSRFRLNLPAIQAANYVAMPLQFALIFPFIRLGGWLFPFASHPVLSAGMLLHGSPAKFFLASGTAAGQAVGAWLFAGIPAVMLMTFFLTGVFRRVSAIAKVQSGD